MNIPVNVYAESTPNPQAMKFVCSVMLLQDGVAEYMHTNEAESSPLAQQLFAFSGVTKVFITSNFVTITKSEGIDWYEISNILREFIRNFIMTGEKVFISNPIEKEPEQPANSVSGLNLPDFELEQQIINMLDEYVKPAVEQDGGAIHFKSFNNGVVTVALKGSCSGCPSSTLTLKSGIENLLKKMVPQVTEVVAEAE